MQNELRSLIKRNSELTDKLLARAEMTALALCVAGIFLMMRRVEVSSYMLLTGISLLAFVYAFHGHFLSEIFSLTETSLLVKFVKAGYLSLTIATIGILFRLQYWPGGKAMLLSGCAASGALFLFFLYKMYFGTIENDRLRLVINNLIVRMLPVLLIVAFLIALTVRE